MAETKPKPFVFVLMPFSDEFSDIYELGIRAACDDAGAYCERVDKQIFTESILARIYNQIAKADIIVADMSDRNPNVFYETGYAHALNKQVILLTKDSNDIPFDLKLYPHIVYGGKITTLKLELTTRVHWCIDNPGVDLSTADINPRFLVDGVPLAADTETEISADKISGYISLNIAIHNPTQKVIDPSAYSLALIAPETIYPPMDSGAIRSVIQQPHEETIWNLAGFDPLFPDGWDRVEWGLIRVSTEVDVSESVRLTLRCYSAVAPKDYPFRIRFRQ